MINALYLYRNYLIARNTEEYKINEIINIISNFFRLTSSNPLKISGSEAIDIYKRLYQLPSYMKQKKELNGLFGAELINKSIESDFHVISIATAEKYLTVVNMFLNFLLSIDFIDKNPFSYFKARSNETKNNEERKAFSEKQINKVIKESLINEIKISDMSWVILIAIELGMRQNEICQLTVDDIVLKEKIWCIFITNRKVDQHIKNEYSMRYLPLTKNLISLGFLDFVKSKDRMIFESFTYCKKNKYSRKASESFSKINKLLFNDELLKFHSFRHYFISKLKYSGVVEDIAAEISGHKHDRETYGRYGKERSIKEKRAILNKNSSRSVKKLVWKFRLNKLKCSILF